MRRSVVHAIVHVPLTMRFLPLTILLAFTVVDAAANWRLIPSVTVSEWVWSHGLLGRFVAGAVLSVLFAHLVLQWPFGPAGR